MKVCYFCNEYPPKPHGGLGTYVKIIAEALVDEGHEITVVGFGENNTDCSINGVRVIEVKPYNVFPRLGVWLNRFRLHAFLKKFVISNDIDIVEIPDCEGWLPFPFPYCKVVVRLHLSKTVISDYLDRKMTFLIGIFERLTLNKNRTWVGVSKWAYDKTVQVFGYSPIRNEIVYSPVTLPESKSYDLGLENYMLYAGTVSDRKGAITVARAAVDIMKKFPDLYLVYAGKVESESTKGEIKAILGGQLCKRVVFTGYIERNEVIDIMRKARVFVFPSKLETFGLVIAEAMLCGIPTICCDIGPCPEFVNHGKTGLLVSADDHIALANEVNKVLSDTKVATELSYNGKMFVVENFSIEKSVRENVYLYKSLVKGNN